LLQEARQALEVLRYSSLQSTLKAFAVNTIGSHDDGSLIVYIHE